MKKQCFMLALVVVSAAWVEIVSLKLPDGRNEIRLTTAPSLSYSVLRDGQVRVGPAACLEKKTGWF